MFAEECRIFGFKLNNEAHAGGDGVAVLVKEILPMLRQIFLNLILLNH